MIKLGQIRETAIAAAQNISAAMKTSIIGCIVAMVALVLSLVTLSRVSRG